MRRPRAPRQGLGTASQLPLGGAHATVAAAGAGEALSARGAPLLVAAVPGLKLESPNRTHNEHWSKRSRRAKGEKAAVGWALRAARLAPPPLPLAVTVVRCGPQAFDVDNNVASMKAVIDATAAYLGVDDRDARVAWSFAQERAPGYAVRVELREAGTRA